MISQVLFASTSVNNFSLFPNLQNCACCEKYLTDNKHNSLQLTPKICSDICPWTLSVPQSSVSPKASVSSSNALGKLSASFKTDNVRGQYPSIFSREMETIVFFYFIIFYRQKATTTVHTYTKFENKTDIRPAFLPFRNLCCPSSMA